MKKQRLLVDSLSPRPAQYAPWHYTSRLTWVSSPKRAAIPRRSGLILDLTHTHPPYTVEGLVGLPAWNTLGPDDALVCQAAILRCVQSGAPQTFDTNVRAIGRWRTTINRCRVGKVRLVGLVRKIPEPVELLTARQREICAMLGQGLTSTEIARKIERARETVDNHRAAIAKRIGVKPWSLVAWCGEHREWF